MAFFSKNLLLLAILPALILARSISLFGNNNNDYSAHRNLEEGDNFEGDIILIPGQLDKNGQLLDIFRWPNATVYFQLGGAFEAAGEMQELVLEAISDFHAKTCVRFEPWDGIRDDYVLVTDVDAFDCSSFIGRLGGQQRVNLSLPGCERVGTIIHELMHAVGFFHEQSRLDRDDYVDIIWDNILPGLELQFVKAPSTPFNVSYDYGSIMHYNSTAFTANGNVTIVPKDPDANIGQRIALSEKDAIKINAMYNCTQEEFVNLL